MSATTRGTIIAVYCAIVMGLWPPATRAVYINGGNPIFVMIVTTWARAGTLAVYCLARRYKLFTTSAARRAAVSGGIFQTISILGLLSALEFLPGPLVIIILYTHTLMLLFFMAWRREAKLDLWTILTSFSALFGLSLVLDIWHVHAEMHLIGIALAFVGAFATLSRLYVFGKQTQTRNPIIVGAETFIIAAILLSIVALFKMPVAPVTGKAYIDLALGCVSMIAGTFGLFYSVSLIGAFKYSLFTKLEPISTALFSFLLLGEILNPLQYVGMTIVLGSLLTYQIISHRFPVKASS